MESTMESLGARRPDRRGRAVAWASRAVLLAAVLAFGFGAAGLAAQSAAGAAQGGAQSSSQPDNPFDEGAFDQSVQSSLSSPESAKTSYLVGGSTLVEAQAYAPSGLDSYFAESSAMGKLFAKVSVPDYGSLYVAYAYTYAFLEGSSGYADAATTFGAADLSALSLSLAELHYSFDIAKTLFVRLGDQLISWGPSRIWTPVDFINTERINPFQSIDTRLGRSGLRLHLPFRGSDAFVFADFSQSVSNGVVGDLAATTRLAARYDLTLGDFELGLTGYCGEAVRGEGGFDFSGRILGTTVYGEAAVAPESASSNARWSGSLGFERALDELKRWTLAGEFFYQSTGGDYSGQTSVMASLPSLYMGAYYAYASLEAKEFGSPSLATTLYTVANLSDGSYTVRLQEDFSYPRAVPFSLALSYFGGGADKEFTYLTGDGSLGITLQTLIQF